MPRLEIAALSLAAIAALGGCTHGAAALPASVQRQPSMQSAQIAAMGTGNIDVDVRRVLNTIRPRTAIGGGVDSENNGAPALIYTPENVRKMLTAGLGPVSYRLYTELSVQDWHWNPTGSWSDAQGQGYFTGSAQGGSINSSFGYRLPHRGFTHDQGNDDTYGRLTDGDLTTYWKSNPYLSQRFTGEDDALHAGWIVVDLGSRQPIDAIKLWWASPYAVVYRVQYWTGSDPINSPGDGSVWKTFPGGQVTNGSGGTVTLRLSNQPLHERYVRVLMTASSNTCDSHGSADVRNCVGFAVYEIGAGTLDAGGGFHDVVVHLPGKKQTATYVSSVDPWHAPENRVTNQEQPGLDLVFQSGLTRGIPAVVPVSMLYGIPDDAANEIAYLQSHYPIASIELGEEPDGQYILPEDYGALYVQWAKRLRGVSSLPLGGPVFQGVTSDVQAWPNASGDVSWLHRFLSYLNAHAQSANLNFMSFEHYPFGPCDANPLNDLLREPQVVARVVKQWHSDGLPQSTPMAITELNFSASPTAWFQDVVGGLWFADFAGSFLSDGGKQLFLYQYVPEQLYRNSGGCTTWGEYGLFVGRNDYSVHYYGSQYFAAQLLTQDWADPKAADLPHEVLSSQSSIVNTEGQSIVSSYAVKRPDGSYALLLVNKSAATAYRVGIAFHAGGSPTHYSGAVAITSFGPAEYQWHPNGSNGYAQPDGPAQSSVVQAGANTTFAVPPESIVALSGHIR